jgi:hypothetical protein
MGKLTALINPLTLVQQAIGALVALVLVAALLWFFNSKVRDHYQAPLIAEYKATADSAEATRLKREFVNKERVTDAKDAKLKTLENNLIAAKRTADSAIGLRDAVRASEDRAQTSLAACVQHSHTLGELLASGAELAGRIAKEADGHAADSLECHTAWPQ